MMNFTDTTTTKKNSRLDEQTKPACQVERFVSRDASWIGGLMKEMTNAVQPGCFSIIPFQSIEFQYVKNQRYVIQNDEKGKRVGYILHGAIQRGKPLVITQHAIQYEKWLHGYGEKAFNVVLTSAKIGGSSSIWLRCAEDLPAIKFWEMMGFQIHRIEAGGKKRDRTIFVMVRPLYLPLLNIYG